MFSPIPSANGSINGTATGNQPPLVYDQLMVVNDTGPSKQIYSNTYNFYYQTGKDLENQD